MRCFVLCLWSWFSVGFFTEYFSHCGFSSDFSLVDVGHHPPKSGLSFRPQLLCFGWLFVYCIVSIMTLSGVLHSKHFWLVI